MEKVFIVGYKRSPFTKYLGKFLNTNLIDFSSYLLTTLINDSFVNANDINEVLVGNVLSGNKGMNVARQIAIKAGIPNYVIASTTNMVCGSGMKTIIDAFYKIKYANKDLIVAGGVESMSSAPIYQNYDRVEKKVLDGNTDSITNEGLTDVFSNLLMGQLVEKNANDLNISRQEQEMFSYQSQLKAINAHHNKQLFEEIVPIEVDNMYYAKDEAIYPNPSLEKMSKLKPIFGENQTITAATASSLADGASFVMLASEKYAKANDLTMIAEIIDVNEIGLDPSFMGLAPAKSIEELLENNNLHLNDIDIFEINEAFAAQTLGVVKLISKKYDEVEKTVIDKLNLYGGAIALGHPLAASSNRIVGSLAYQLRKNKKQYGIASVCIGGGMATSILLKK